MRTAEVCILGDNLVERLTDIRVWLDEHRYQPSSFTYFFLHPGMMIRVLFKIDDEAEAFAKEFTENAAEHWAKKKPSDASRNNRVGVLNTYRPRRQTGWSRALVRHGADAREANAAVLGVRAEQIGVRDLTRL